MDVVDSELEQREEVNEKNFLTTAVLFSLFSLRSLAYSMLVGVENVERGRIKMKRERTTSTEKNNFEWQ
jgi:hypothetical protein